MAYPPTVTPITRSDNTVMATNHATDHNQAEDGLTEIIAKIGNGSNASSYAAYATMDARYLAYGKGASIIIAHATSHDAWKEAADYVIGSSTSAAADTTAGATATATVNTAIGLLADVDNSTGFGGGKILFAPCKKYADTAGAFYHFDTATNIVVSSNCELEFLGGTGASFDGNTDVQVYFGAGVIMGPKTSLILGSGTYVTGKVVSTGFGEPLGGIIVYNQTGVYIGNPHGVPGQTTILQYSGADTSVGSIALYGLDSTANFANRIKIENITIDGNDRGVIGLRLKNVALLTVSNVYIGFTGTTTASKGAGCYIDNVWDSFFDNVRFDWCGTRGITTAANVRGCFHLKDTGGASNNIQLRNVTFETFGDRAIHIETGNGSGATADPNKFYWDNLKIENSIMYNSPLIHVGDIEAIAHGLAGLGHDAVGEALGKVE